ncbi:MAG: glycosyltransferase family 2 protein [Solirubrobacterales bacterium]|nr:glycosyltransferase family 2 protein [Solirubrobacterales bacterium]MBV9943716.1 glycosyltransferase family 2 protein [Solirubrobacterales bacterium]
MTARQSGSAIGVVAQCELSVGVPALTAPASGITALVLVRVFGEPIGMLSLELSEGTLEPAALAREIADEFEVALRERFADCAITWTGSLPTDGLEPGRTPSFLKARQRALAEGPEITAAICTRDRPDDLLVALEGLHAQDYPRLRTLVVDNAPSDDRTRRLVAELARTREIEYVTEPRPGLSWARNRALDASTSEIIAWVDDDEVCDPSWATEIARAFIEVPEAGGVTGLVAPAELETQCQAWFEQYSGVGRGRGFARAVFSPATAHEQSPLYPLPPYGAGANMAFRRDAIERIGRFDCALGTGTATLAGEDTAAFSALLLAGGTIVYQPSAIVHHRHRRDYAALERVMLGYGRGLSAYYASMLARRPSCLPELVRLTGRAVRDQLAADGQRLRDLHGFPPELLRLNRKGLLQGAFMYPGAWLRARRMAAMAAGS